jgi:phage tail-like protein
MPRFTVNSDRFDPYLNFKFKVMFDGDYVAGLNKCSALRKTTEVTTWHEAGDQSTGRRIPGKTSFDPVTLEAGITFDRTFESWANSVNNYQAESAMSLRHFRKDLSIDVFNLQGVLILRYHVHRCWVSQYQALPELAADGSAVMITSIRLENEGWERDVQITELPET